VTLPPSRDSRERIFKSSSGEAATPEPHLARLHLEPELVLKGSPQRESWQAGAHLCLLLLVVVLFDWHYTIVPHFVPTLVLQILHL
jgi:hypothetical protein